MNRLIFATGVLILAALVLYSCNTDKATGPEEDVNSYFPNSNGNYYKYTVERTDSTGTQSEGERSSTYQGTKVVAGSSYQVQIDSIFFTGLTTVSESYFNKSDDGVGYFLDTTGVSEFIPDSLIQYIDLSTDITVLSFPYQEGKDWSVFSMSLVYGALSFDLVDVNAFYEGKENVTLPQLGETKEAIKVKYVMNLDIPDPNNIFQTYQSSYTAFAWLVDGIGYVKWEGNGTITNAISGNGVDFDDTTSTVTMTLIEYNVN